MLAAFGMVLAAAYFLRVMRRVGQGQPLSEPLPDITEVEAAAWVPLAALILVLGLLPGLLLSLTNPAVERILSNSAVSRRSTDGNSDGQLRGLGAGARVGRGRCSLFWSPTCSLRAARAPRRVGFGHIAVAAVFVPASSGEVTLCVQEACWLRGSTTYAGVARDHAGGNSDRSPAVDRGRQRCEDPFR